MNPLLQFSELVANCGGKGGKPGPCPDPKTEFEKISREDAFAIAMSRGYDSKHFGSDKAVKDIHKKLGAPTPVHELMMSMSFQERLSFRNSGKQAEASEDYMRKFSEFKAAALDRSIGAKITSPSGAKLQVTGWGFDNSGGDAPELVDTKSKLTTKVNVVQMQHYKIGW